MINKLETYFDKDAALQDLIQNKDSKIIEITGETDAGKTSLALYWSKKLEQDSITFYQSFDKKITSSYLVDIKNCVLSLEAGVDNLSKSLFLFYEKLDLVIIDGFPFCDEPKRLLNLLQVIKERRKNITILLINQLRYSFKKEKNISFYDKYVNRVIDYKIFLSKENQYINVEKIRKTGDLKSIQNLNQLFSLLQ